MARTKLFARDIRDQIARKKLNLMTIGQPPTNVVTTPVTLGDFDHVVLVDDTTVGGQVTVNLPAASDNEGTMYWIKKVGNTANVVIDPNASETLDGDATKTITVQYTSLTIYCDGNNWFIV